MYRALLMLLWLQCWQWQKYQQLLEQLGQEAKHKQLVGKSFSQAEMWPKQNPRSKNGEKIQMYLQKLWLNPCSAVPLAFEQNINQVVVNAQGVAVVDTVQYSPKEGTKSASHSKIQIVFSNGAISILCCGGISFQTSKKSVCANILRYYHQYLHMLNFK